MMLANASGIVTVAGNGCLSLDVRDRALTSLSGQPAGSDECALGEGSVFLAQGPVEVLREAAGPPS